MLHNLGKLSELLGIQGFHCRAVDPKGSKRNYSLYVQSGHDYTYTYIDICVCICSSILKVQVSILVPGPFGDIEQFYPRLGNLWVSLPDTTPKKVSTESHMPPTSTPTHPYLLCVCPRSPHGVCS